MSQDSRLQIAPKSGDSSLSVSSGRSGLIARGRQDVAVLADLHRPESQELANLVPPVGHIVPYEGGAP